MKKYVKILRISKIIKNSIDIVDDNLLFFVKSFDNHMDKELLKNKVR